MQQNYLELQNSYLRLQAQHLMQLQTYHEQQYFARQARLIQQEPIMVAPPLPHYLNYYSAHLSRSRTQQHLSIHLPVSEKFFHYRK